MQKRYSFPILFLLLWLGFTILSFAFGPYVYKLTNPFIFYSFLFLIHLSLLVGYLLGQREKGAATRLKFDYFRLLKGTIIISVVYLVLKMVFTKGGDIRFLFTAFSNAAERYANNSFKHTNIFSYFDMFFIPISYIAITNSICCYNSLKIKYKFGVFFYHNSLNNIFNWFGNEGWYNGIVYPELCSFFIKCL